MTGKYFRCGGHKNTNAWKTEPIFTGLGAWQIVLISQTALWYMCQRTPFSRTTLYQNLVLTHCTRSRDIGFVCQEWYGLRLAICNSLTSGGFELNFRSVISKLVLVFHSWGTSSEIAHNWLSLDCGGDKLISIQVTACYYQATCHYFSQCLPGCDVTR